MIINTITDIGDSLVMSGVTLTGTLYLLLHGCRKGAFALLLAFLGSAALIGITKLAFIGCSAQLHNNYELRSPSGHSALSTAVIGTYILIIASQLRGLWRFIPVILLVPLILAIAVTRVLLSVHSIQEVIVGLAIGSITLLCVHAFLTRGKNLPKFNAYALILYALLAAIVLHGFRLPAESFIHYLASFLTNHAAFCTR
jgi:undecaprenyl-diphosphatase